MPTIHVHANGREQVFYMKARLPGLNTLVQATRDAGSLRAKYEDLAERMLRAARDLHARTGDARTVDDQEGHQFHGNQHTGGIKGPHKPTGHSQKTAKAAVHELLSSGHPFTKEELMSIAGVKTPKLFADYMAMLKHPKYAGPKGALKIEKNADGMYYVSMPDGSVAPPPTEKLDLSKIPDPAPAPASTLIEDPDDDELELEPGMPGYVPPVVHAPPVQPPAEAPHGELENEDGLPINVQQSHLGVMLGAQPGSMMKSEADKHYADHIDQAYDGLKEAVNKGLGVQAMLLDFKQAKSDAMSAWAQAVHGHAFKTKAQQVFKADNQLVQDIENGMGKGAALVKWKHNTALEKQGLPFSTTPGAAPAATPAAAPSPPPLPSLNTLPPAVPVPAIDYHAIHPKNATGISDADIMSGHFEKQFHALHASLESVSKKEPEKNKAVVEHLLRDKLKDAPNFQALKARLGLSASGPGSLEGRLIQAWASSSGDNRPLSTALQMAARDAFSIPDSHIEKTALHALKNHGGEDGCVHAGMKLLLNNSKGGALSNAELPTARAALQEFVQAQYHATQEHLKAAGHDFLYMARGMGMKSGKNSPVGPAALKLQPASSFSVDYSTARSFGHGGTVYLVKVPRQQVLSSYMTGFGCTGEHELVVLAHEKLKAYGVPYDAAQSVTGAVARVAEDLAQGMPPVKAKPALKKKVTA